MKAMIFAAGLGTRLLPLTNEIPKPLIKIGNIPLIEYAIKKISKYGFKDIIINVHHHFQKIIDYIESKNKFGFNITFSVEKEKLLDTGGGLKNAKWFFNDNMPFLVFNCDLVTDLNLSYFYNYHLEKKALCTLAVRKRETERYFLFNEKMILSGWLNKASGQRIIISTNDENLNPYAFSGVHIIHPDIFGLMPDKEIFSLVELYMNIGSENKIVGYEHSTDFWIDIGKINSLEKMSEHNLEKYY